MPTASDLVVRQDTVAVPANYQVPNAAQIVLHTVTAEFVDNGAIADWLPAVVILDAAGHVIARAVDQGVKVTAGLDAEVTWFSGVKGAAAAATAAGAVFAQAFRDALGGSPDPAQQVNAGATNNATFPHSLTTDATAVLWSASAGTTDTANLLKVGTYLISAATHWDTVDVLLSALIKDAGQDDFPHTPWVPNTNPSFGDGIGSANSMDYTVAHVVTPPSSVTVLLDNKSAGNRFAQQSYFTVLYIPTT